MGKLCDEAKVILKTALTDLIAGKSVALTFSDVQQAVSQEITDEFNAILRYHGIADPSITLPPVVITPTVTTTTAPTATTIATAGTPVGTATSGT